MRREWFLSKRPARQPERRATRGGTRYLNAIEESRKSGKPLPLEVIENVQEAIWFSISSSVKAVLRGS